MCPHPYVPARRHDCHGGIDGAVVIDGGRQHHIFGAIEAGVMRLTPLGEIARNLPAILHKSPTFPRRSSGYALSW